MNIPVPFSSLANDHHREWVEGSGVDPIIAALNVRTLEDTEVVGTDVSYPIHEALGWHLVRFGRTTRSNIRGWWVNGVDPLNDCKPMLWGRFKPDSDTPVLDREKNAPAKYLSPKKETSPSRATFLRVAWRTGLKVAEKCGLETEYRRRIKGFDLDQEDRFFWKWVVETSLVNTLLTEGEKKAGKLLTEGYAAIALPGIASGARSKDEHGNPLFSSRLIPELQLFATPGREISICFDYETKPKTIKAIQRETEKLKGLFIKAGCKFKVIELPGPEKGVDDFILAQGADAFHQVFAKRLNFDRWQARRYNKLTFKPTQTINQRYLGNLQIPDDARFVAIKSPKGTGKTESFVELASEAMRNGQRVLLLSHRVQLAEAICKRIGLNYITEVRGSEEGALLGYGLCIDSLHPNSQARFNAEHWNDALVIMDEVEQLAWHLLDATTEVSSRRTTILEQLQTLLTNTLESEGGRLVIVDADLSDISIELVHSLILNKVPPHLIVNQYKPDAEAWEVNWYSQHKADAWLTALDRELATGGKPFVVLQSQKRKSKYSTTALEALFTARYPNLKILRIDSESISDPGHPAFQCTADLNEVVQRYDCVLASPTIETGVSIDVRGHFTSVWGCLNGVVSDSTARQSLARVREPIPRHIWIAKRGTTRAANGSSSRRAILSGEYRQNQVAGKLLQLSFLDSDLADSYGACLKIWAKLAARINAGMIHYRESILAGLEEEGHHLFEQVDCIPSIDLVGQLEDGRDDLRKARWEGVAYSPDSDQKEFDVLKNKKNKTTEERYKEEKFVLRQRYQVEVTPELVKKDEDGWYPKIRLHYFLGYGNQFLKDRDEQSIKSTLETSGAWLPTVNRSHLSTRVWLIEQLGIKGLMNLDEEFNGGMKSENYEDCHPALRKLADLAIRNSWDIKNTLGITVSEKMSPIQIAQTLLGKIGIKLRCDRQVGGRGQRQRIYVYELPKDGRDEIFSVWFARDETARQQREVHNPSINKEIASERGAA